MDSFRRLAVPAASGPAWPFQIQGGRSVTAQIENKEKQNAFGFLGFPFGFSLASRRKTPQKGAVKKASLTRRRVRSISQEILESSPPTLMLTSIYAHTFLSRARHFKSTQATDARPQSRPSAARRLRGLACDLFQCIAWKYFQGGQDCEKTAGRSRKTRGDRRIAARLREDYGKTAG